MIFFGFVFTIVGELAITKWSIILGFWKPVFEVAVLGIGTSLMISGILAFFVSFFVDRPLKESLLQEAFGRVLGWVTPDRLKPELMRVYREPFFAIEQHMVVTLTEKSSAITRMDMAITRTIKNESLEKRELPHALAVRDWFAPDRESKVTGISAQFQGVQYDNREHIEEIDKDAIDLRRERLTPPIMMDQGEEAAIYAGGFEDKLPSDVHWMVFRIPSENPRVTVIHPPSIGVYVQFNSISGQNNHTIRCQPEGKMLRDEWRLRGVMLPNQPVIIRWWPKGNESATQHTE